MDKEILIRVNDSALDRQVRSLTKVIEISKDSISVEEKEDLEGIWNMCHCILDKCEEW